MPYNSIKGLILWKVTQTAHRLVFYLFDWEFVCFAGKRHPRLGALPPVEE